MKKKTWIALCIGWASGFGVMFIGNYLHWGSALTTLLIVIAGAGTTFMWLHRE